eukprot:10696003-Alexandrium_andersonii.AAC.1
MPADPLHVPPAHADIGLCVSTDELPVHGHGLGERFPEEEHGRLEDFPALDPRLHIGRRTRQLLADPSPG